MLSPWNLWQNSKHIIGSIKISTITYSTTHIYLGNETDPDSFSFHYCGSDKAETVLGHRLMWQEWENHIWLPPALNHTMLCSRRHSVDMFLCSLTGGKIWDCVNKNMQWVIWEFTPSDHYKFSENLCHHIWWPCTMSLWEKVNCR